MTIRIQFLRFACAALLVVPVAVQAQDPQHDGRAEHQPHLFAAADFGIDPTSVTFNKDIAPILERSCIELPPGRNGAAPMAFTSVPGSAPLRAADHGQDRHP